MAKKKLSDDSIPNFSFQSISGISIDLMTLEDDRESDEVATFFNPMINLHFETDTLESGESKTTKLIVVPTAIYDECPHCAVTQVAELASMLFEYEYTFDAVCIFDADGDIIDELSLADLLNKKESEEVKSEEKYDLASMQIGVPVIQ